MNHFESRVLATLACPLPVVRKTYDPETDGYVRGVLRCGEYLYLKVSEDSYLYDDGPDPATGPTWEVVCGTGHVLILPDHEADDDYTLIPFDWNAIRDVLPLLARWAEERVS